MLPRHRHFVAPMPDPQAAIAVQSVTLRVLTQMGELRACVVLQESTWGRDAETVAASLLLVSSKFGGLVIGAYNERGTLLGFVFSLTGTDAQGALHWSHMLAVSSDARGVGLGRLLKERQRAELASRGVNRIAWTFDPLQSRNAHLNINRLGARVVEYIDDMYGATGSPLHLFMATDRLVVMTGPELFAAPSRDVKSEEGLPVLTLSKWGVVGLDEPAATTILVEVPWDINEIASSDAILAARWRDATRRHFHFGLANGFAVSGFVADWVALRAYYCFTRASTREVR